MRVFAVWRTLRGLTGYRTDVRLSQRPDFVRTHVSNARYGAPNSFTGQKFLEEAFAEDGGQVGVVAGGEAYAGRLVVFFLGEVLPGEGVVGG